MIIHGDGDSRGRHRLQFLLLEIALFAKDSSAHFKNCLESFTTDLGVLSETFNARVFNLVLNLLPSTTECGDFSFLGELGRGRCRWLIGDGFTDVEDIRPGKIVRAHGDLLRDWINVGNLVDVGSSRSAEEGKNPLWYGLVASNQAFGS